MATTPVITWYEIPTTNVPQTFSIQLNGVTYNLTLVYHDNPLAGWTLDIADNNNNNLLCGVPLVTGQDLLAQFRYLNIGGALVVSTDGAFFASPTYSGLGSTSHVWFGVRTA